ncbi:dihydrolipoyllysine acetyltransferase, partial [bacterium]|nr:dihydrolipoyllysine acetyltransferase [bacterium]
MATEFKLPEVGEDVEKATIVTLMVSKGDKIEKDQPLIEIETDKVTLEIPSPSGGTIQDVKVSEGDEVEV